MKSKIYSLAFITINSLASFGQAPAWQWAKKGGGNSNDIGNSIAVDANGNSYITGTFDSPAIVFGSTTLTNNGGIDLFVVKYDASGNVVWAKNSGGTGDDSGTGIAVDPNGNSYITGNFNSATIAFGSTILTNTGGADFFIVKYDASGNAVWAKSAGGNSSDNGTGIAADANGNSFVTGNFESASIAFGSTTLTNSGGADVFVTGYDASGNVIWASSSGGTGNDYGTGIAIDGSGNSYITGTFNSMVAVFGSTTLSNVDATGLTGDLFIVKYNNAGNVSWAKRAGGTDSDAGNGIAVDFNGNSYITGYFLSPTITFGTTTLTVTGGADVFTAKYDGSGNASWAISASGPGGDAGTGIAVDANGNSFVTGHFKSATINFGSTVLSNSNVSGNSYDIFLVKYGALGNVSWAKSTGGTFGDGGNGIAADASGNSFITGYFVSGSVSFGSITLSNTASGHSDVFVAKSGSATGIEEENIPFNSIKIFPNPGNGKFEITSEVSINELEIRDVSGQVIYKSKQVERSIELKIEREGLYFVTVRTGNETVVRKVVEVSE